MKNAVAILSGTEEMEKKRSRFNLNTVLNVFKYISIKSLCTSHSFKNK